MIDSVKAMANQVAENNQLRIRWGESGGNTPSGEALRILEIENLEGKVMCLYLENGSIKDMR